jgi:hypothetical protein
MKAVVRKAIVISLLTVCFGTLGTTIYLDEHFYRMRPRTPQTESGRIYPQWIHHGARVYLTRVETFPFEYSWYVFAISITAAYLLNRRWKILRSPGDQVPKKFY